MTVRLQYRYDYHLTMGQEEDMCLSFLFFQKRANKNCCCISNLPTYLNFSSLSLSLSQKPKGKERSRAGLSARGRSVLPPVANLRSSVSAVLSVTAGSGALPGAPFAAVLCAALGFLGRQSFPNYPRLPRGKVPFGFSERGHHP